MYIYNLHLRPFKVGLCHGIPVSPRFCCGGAIPRNVELFALSLRVHLARSKSKLVMQFTYPVVSDQVYPQYIRTGVVEAVPYCMVIVSCCLA